MSGCHRAVAPLLLTTVLCLAGPAVGQLAATDGTAAWGDVAHGLQLSISTGINTEALTESQSMLYLSTQVRNVSDVPVFVDMNSATYDFEYEIDGTWYAFESVRPVRDSGSSLSRADLELVQAIAPESSRWTMLTVPLAGRYPGLYLNAVTADGSGRRFESTPGPHVIRVRPGRAALETEQAPVSNAVTVSFRTPPRSDTREQSVTFVSSEDYALPGFSFARGPEGGQAFIRDVLERPPNLATAPDLINARELEILDSIPFYELVLPRRYGAPNAPLPTEHTIYYYLVRTGDLPVGIIGLVADQDGPMLHWVGTATAAATIINGLHALSSREQHGGAAYEPRILRVTGVRGTLPLQVLWLHDLSGGPDLFYRPQDPDFRGETHVETAMLYTSEDFLTSARSLPVEPRYDEGWAVATAAACAGTATTRPGSVLLVDDPNVEIGLSDGGDHIVWYVYFPERLPRGIAASHTGAAFFVDEADGQCARANLGG